jgi:hypothetical protein
MLRAVGVELRYGVIGTGMMGIEHLKNLALLPGAEVVAFADPHEESRRWARLTAGEAPTEYADHRALLDDPRVDAVVIATPNHTHRAVLEEPPPWRGSSTSSGAGRSGASACSRSASTASRSCRRSATGTASPRTPAVRSSRSAATSST